MRKQCAARDSSRQINQRRYARHVQLVSREIQLLEQRLQN
jgi:hypothetical protein